MIYHSLDCTPDKSGASEGNVQDKISDGLRSSYKTRTLSVPHETPFARRSASTVHINLRCNARARAEKSSEHPVTREANRQWGKCT